MARRSYTTRSSRLSVRGVPATMDAVIRVASDLRSNPPSSIRFGEVCRLFGFINRSHAWQYLHNRVLDCQQYRVWCRSTDVQCGDYHSVLWTIFTHTLCVERGYIGPSTVPGSWEWAGTFFVFFKHFCFFFFARSHWFFKSPTRNKESTRFTLTRNDCSSYILGTKKKKKKKKKHHYFLSLKITCHWGFFNTLP